MKTRTHLLQKILALGLLGTISYMLAPSSLAQSPWTQKADMLYSAVDPSICMLDGKLYVMGGLEYYSYTESNYALDSVSVYDPEQDSWSLLAKMPNNRTGFSSYAYNGKILAIGGDRSVYYTPVSAIDIYDPVSDTWSHLTDIPLAGIWQPAVLLDDKIYVFGGSKSDSEFPYDNVQIYNLLTDTWSEGAKMLTPRFDGSAIALNDKIYVMGGQQGKLTSYMGMTTVEVYDPASDRWEIRTDMIIPRKWHANCLLGSSIYVFGGISGSSCSDYLSGGAFYDPNTDWWREITPNIKIKGPCKIAPYNGNIYVCGGEVTSCNDNETFDAKSLYLYDPYFDLYPIVEEIGVNKNAVYAGADSVLIFTRMYDPAGITLEAKLTTLEGLPMDSIQLYDDGNHNDGSAGDSLFANMWQVSSAEELQYSFGLVLTRSGADTIVNEFDNRDVIATKELVTYEDFSYHPDDTVPDPGDRITFTIDVHNNSSRATATNIKAKLRSLNGLGWFPNSLFEFQDIAPGESVTSDFFSFLILKNCPRDTVLAFGVDISNFGHVFRTDTLYIPIEADSTTSIADLTSSMVRIYPNPAGDLITIETGQSGPLWIEITSLNGQLLFSKRREGPTHQIDLSSFPKGIYMITMKSSELIEIRKLIKLE